MLWTTAGWPIWGGCLLMFVAAIIDARTERIPNVLTVPCFLTALVIAILWGNSGLWPSLGGGIDSSLLTAGVTFVVLLVAWLYGFVAAGGVKMQTAFAAWLGCALPCKRALLLSLVPVAFVFLTFLVVACGVRWTHRGNEDGGERCTGFRYQWVAAVSIATTLLLDWMGLI